MQSSSKLFEYLFSSCRTSFHLETERRQMQDVMSLAYLYLNRLIHYLPTSFITANSAELFFMVTRKLLVKKLEVPFIKYVINSEVSLFFPGRETTRRPILRTPSQAAYGSFPPFYPGCVK